MSIRLVKRKNQSAEFEPATSGESQIYLLKLCISGMTPRSRQALINLKLLCDEYLAGNYSLEVIDLYQQPELAARHRIIATPTLLKNLPLPVRQMFGDLSDTKAILRRLGIAIEEDEPA
ncbi:MAG: circadian clock KaiB family protein [Candidatus Binatia bacterium]